MTVEMEEEEFRGLGNGKVGDGADAAGVTDKEWFAHGTKR